MKKNHTAAYLLAAESLVFPFSKMSPFSSNDGITMAFFLITGEDRETGGDRQTLEDAFVFLHDEDAPDIKGFGR